MVLTQMNEPSDTNNKIKTLDAIAKRVKKRARVVQLWDPNVCDFTIRNSVEHVALSGYPFSHEVRFKHKGRRITISANPDWLCIGIRKGTSDPELPVCSVNQANKIDFRRETGLTVGNVHHFAVFLPRADRSSGVLLGLLESPVMNQAVEGLIRDTSEGLHTWKDGVDLYSKTLEIARNVVESQRLSTLIDYATAAPFTMDFLETASVIEDSSNGI